jgi:hypothetical protein
MLRSLIVVPIAALALAWGAAAQAANYLVPSSGRPALAVVAQDHRPDPGAGMLGKAWLGSEGWPYAEYMRPDMLRLATSDHGTTVIIAMLADPRAGSTSEPEFAARVFREVGAPPYARVEPARLGGLPAKAFVGVMTKDGVPLQVRMILAKVDPGHYAYVVVLQRPKARQAVLVNDLLYAIRIAR